MNYKHFDQSQNVLSFSSVNRVYSFHCHFSFYFSMNLDIRLVINLFYRNRHNTIVTHNGYKNHHDLY